MLNEALRRRTGCLAFLTLLLAACGSLPLDVCGTNNGGCDANALCSPGPAGRLCTCRGGFAGDGLHCEDVDECATAAHGCDAHATCLNTVGGYECRCGAGWKGTGLTCTDIDECADGTSPCDPRATCTNDEGSFRCACPDGWTGDGMRCTDVDECAAAADPCGLPGACRNADGGYTCACPAGYEAHDGRCVDLDECAAGTPCDPLATCENVSGSFFCTCPAGYRTNGTRCEDVDECAARTAACDARATCTNTPGDYVCACPAGLVGDGRRCVAGTPISGGNQHACGVRADGTLFCWGGNDFGALGTGQASWESVPQPIGPAGAWRTVSAGGYHTCAVRRDGTLWCWGHNDAASPIGVGTTVDQPVPARVGTATDWREVSAATGNTCAIRGAGTLWCWGYDYGGLGVNTTESPVTAPSQVGHLDTWQSLCTGGNVTRCAIRRDGSLYCWGLNSSGEVGDGQGGHGSGESTPVPTLVAGGPWARVTCGLTHTCAIDRAGALWCWGSNGEGELGIGSTTLQPRPVRVGTATDWVDVSASKWHHTCGLRQDGSMWCWGENTLAQLQDDFARQLSPKLMAGGPWKAVGTTQNGSCGERTDGSVWCWGSNDQGVQGDGSVPRRGTSSSIALAAPAASVAGACARLADGSAACWGEGLGQAHVNGAAVPGTSVRVVAGGHAWAFLSANADRACAIDTAGALWCWGRGYGSDVPARIGADSDWEAVDARFGPDTCGLRAGHQLWCWGSNASRELTAASGSVALPIRVTTDTWTSVSTAEGRLCGVKPDATLWCWGPGIVGDGGPGTKSTPTEVGAGASWAGVSLGASASCALRTDGTLWCWGRTESGAVGLPGLAPTLVPTQLLPWQAFRQVSVATRHACALAVDGSLSCWGWNSFGETGDEAAALSLPHPVQPAASWSELSTSDLATCARKVDGAVSCFGAWRGDGSDVRTSPVQVQLPP